MQLQLPGAIERYNLRGAEHVDHEHGVRIRPSSATRNCEIQSVRDGEITHGRFVIVFGFVATAGGARKLADGGGVLMITDRRLACLLTEGTGVRGEVSGSQQIVEMLTVDLADVGDAWSEQNWRGKPKRVSLRLGSTLCAWLLDAVGELDRSGNPRRAGNEELVATLRRSGLRVSAER